MPNLAHAIRAACVAVTPFQADRIGETSTAFELCRGVGILLFGSEARSDAITFTASSG